MSAGEFGRRPRRTSIFLCHVQVRAGKAEGKRTADALTAEAPANVLVGGHADLTFAKNGAR
ncbi:hypothetical protein ACP3TI_12205, partial [Desulforudis sp. 1190]